MGPQEINLDNELQIIREIEEAHQAQIAEETTEIHDAVKAIMDKFIEEMTVEERVKFVKYNSRVESAIFKAFEAGAEYAYDRIEKNIKL